MRVIVTDVADTTRVAPDGPAALTAVALLAEPVRRQLFEFVRRSPAPVTRDEAAASCGISRKLAAFHLDKLVRAGLLRSGTDVRTAGVGRRPKAYEPGDVEVAVSVPPRHYDLLAELLLDAVTAARSPAETDGGAPGEVVAEAGRQAAHRRGVLLGADAREQTRAGRLGPERALTLAVGVLEACGYEPARADPRRVVLRNCPFHRLVDRSRDLVCGLNQAFCAGVVAGLGAPGVTAALTPEPGRCCVQLEA